MAEQTLSFPERSDLNGFQVKDMHTFSSEKQVSRQLKRRKTPEYRRIDKYFKSTKQYWKERNRRKKAYELFDKGFTYEQIAEKLGVCAKTVSNDIKKVRRYYKGQLNSMLQKIQAERNAEYTKRYENLPLASQRKQLLEDYKFFAKMFRLRQRLKETLSLTVRLDEIMRVMANPAAYGRPFLNIQPKTITLPLSRLRLKVHLVDGEQKLGTYIYSVGDWKK